MHKKERHSIFGIYLIKPLGVKQKNLVNMNSQKSSKEGKGIECKISYHSEERHVEDSI